MRHVSRIVLSLGLVSSMALGIAMPSYAQSDEKRTETEAPKPDTDPDANDTYKQLNLFGEVFERVRANYVDPVTDKQLIEYALTGMLANLDPHSSYLTEKDYGDMRVQTKGEFGGLGIEVTMDNG